MPFALVKIFSVCCLMYEVNIKQDLLHLCCVKQFIGMHSSPSAGSKRMRFGLAQFQAVGDCGC